MNERFEWRLSVRWTVVLGIGLNIVLNSALMAGLSLLIRSLWGSLASDTALIMAVAVVAWFTDYGNFHVPPWRRSRTVPGLGRVPAKRVRRPS